MHLRRLAACLALAAAAAAQAAPLQPFRNRNGSFQLDLPAHWRPLAPNEALQVRDLPGAPATIRVIQPRRFYAVGPVDEWLRGDFRGPWLWVVEQDEPWHLGDDFATALAAMWREHGAATGLAHELTEVERVAIGTQAQPAVQAVRTTTPAPPGRAQRSLDVYAPCGSQQVTLAFCGWPEDFDRWRPEFAKWLATLTFARAAPKPATLGDRLWTPLVGGGIVALLLLVLYKHSRGRR